MALPFLSKPTALQRLAASEDHAYASAPRAQVRDRRALIAEALEELRNAKPMQRVKLLKKAGLPERCVSFGAQSSPLLAFIVDDDTLHSALGIPATRVWLQVDGAACIAHVFARADVMSAGVVLLALADARVDKTEAFEVLAPRYRSDSEMRALLTRGFFPGAPSMRSTLSDPRFVDLALELFESDVVSSCRLLGVHGSQRAIDELHAILEGATSFDDSAAAALDGLELAFTQQQFLDLLAALLSSPMFAASSPREIVEGPLGNKLRVHGYVMLQHAAVQRSPRLQEIMMHAQPMVPAG